VIADIHMHLAPDDDLLSGEVLTVDHVAAYVETARASGVSEIGFSEHVYRFTVARSWVDHPFWTEGAVADIDAYVACLESARDEGLPVKIGLELDHVEGREQEAAAVAAGHEWDYLLGSVHWLDTLQMDYAPNAIWEHLSVRDAWERYVRAVCDAAATGTFDSMAHPDLAKVFGHRPSEELERELGAQAAEAFREAGVCAEISSAGLRKAAGDVYPSEIWLEQLRSAGVPITLASDAHRPDDVGVGLDRCLRSASEAGYTSLMRFRGRERQAVPLG
jgi:histidinol-phosphatase (PHP family)